MSQEILNSVLAIESEAKALKEKFEEQLSETNAATDQRVNEAKSNMEQSLEVYKAELKEKKSTKESRVRSESERRRISKNCCARKNVHHLKQDLVQDTVKEVLKRYGNS